MSTQFRYFCNISDMPPKRYPLKQFLAKWLDESEGGVLDRTWLSPDSKDPKRGECLVCKTAGGLKRTFSIAEGYTAITSHMSEEKTQGKHTRSRNEPTAQIF